MQIVLNGVSENIEKEMLISEFIEKLSSEKNINLSGAVAVSYTHLTLPTILRV